MNFVEGESLNACCICQGPTGKIGYINVAPMDVMCLDCAKEIAECYDSIINPPPKGLTCPFCDDGRVFKNPGARASHISRYHAKEAMSSEPLS